MTRSTVSCAAENCERTVWARGWCRKHYTRWWKHGDVNVVLPTGAFMDKSRQKLLMQYIQEGLGPTEIGKRFGVSRQRGLQLIQQVARSTAKGNGR